MKIKIAEEKDTEIIKAIINEMYGFEYEKRELQDIQLRIKDRSEIYVLGFDKGECVGFAGCSFKDKEVTIDYIYMKKEFRNFFNAYEILISLFKEINKEGMNQAYLQVQTYNKQRFLHYAIAAKTIVKEEDIESRGKIYKDQILIIKDIKKLIDMPIRELLNKVKQYQEQ